MKHILRSGFFAAIFFVGAMVFFTDAQAQITGKITVPDSITVGQTITVVFTDSTKAGQTITIKIDNGDHANLKTDSVTMTLDATGKGSANWVVQKWDAAVFQYTTAYDVIRVIP